MIFFNRKEDVIDLQLTQFGKYLLSKGVLRPVYYAFFDDDVLYDGRFGGVEEVQNDIEDRIRETPRLRTQYVFHGIETELKTAINDQRVRAHEDDALDRNLPKITLPQPQAELHYTNTAPLGTSRLGSQKAARWDINFLAGNYTGSISYISSSALPNIKIPQLDVEILYKTKVALGATPTYEEVGQEDNEQTTTSETFEDGTAIILNPQDFLLEIQEKNGFNLNQNFELEVYEVEDEIKEGRLTGKQNLIPLFFPREEKAFTITDDNVYKFEPNKDQPLEIVDPTKVEYFFTVEADAEIDPAILCKAIPVDKTQGVFSRRLFNCRDQAPRAPQNIYGHEEEYEDPCEE